MQSRWNTSREHRPGRRREHLPEAAKISSALDRDEVDQLILGDWISGTSNSGLRRRLGRWYGPLSFRLRHRLRIADLRRHARSLLILGHLFRTRQPILVRSTLILFIE